MPGNAAPLAFGTHADPIAWLRRRWQGPAGLLLLCSLGAALSWAFTGHLPGHSNNVFHLPLLVDLAAQPGMAGDAFVQSLSRFQSGLWILLTGSHTWIHPTLLLALLLFFSKALTLLGLLAVAGELGLTQRRWQLAFVLAMASTPLLRGTAYAGHGGLFVDYFSHSELANGLSLLMWWACLRRRFDIALALNGGVFFINGFMAVWNLAPWCWLGWLAWRADPTLLRLQRRGLLAAGALAVALAAVVLTRAVQAGQLGGADAASSADHVDFLRSYYPYHFLASEMPLSQWLGLAAVAGAAALGLRALGPVARPLAQLGLAYGAVYAVGLVLPLLTSAPLLLNLHLLRSSVHLHFLAALVLGVWMLRCAASPQPWPRGWQAPWLALALLTVRPALLLAPLALLAPRAWRGLRASAIGRWAVVAIALVAVLVQQRSHVATLQGSLRDWAQLAQQVRAQSTEGDVVMLPLNTDSWQPADAGSGAFQALARRPVWVDDKRGAAVFWQPGYRALWQQRRAAQQGLMDWPARLAYARAQGLGVVVDRCDGLDAATPRLAQAGRLCAVRVAGASRPGKDS